MATKPKKTAAKKTSKTKAVTKTPTHDDAYRLVKQVGTAYAFAIGDVVGWNVSQLDLYCLCMAPISAEMTAQIIRRNDVTIRDSQVVTAFQKLAKLNLVAPIQNNSSDERTFEHTDKGKLVLAVIAGNLKDDLRNVKEKDVEKLAAFEAHHLQ